MKRIYLFVCVLIAAIAVGFGVGALLCHDYAQAAAYHVSAAFMVVFAIIGQDFKHDNEV